jgi:hypothetical protein
VGEQQSHGFDHAGLADLRWPVDQRTHDPVVRTSGREIVERLDCRSSNPLIAGGKQALGTALGNLVAGSDRGGLGLGYKYGAIPIIR